MSRTSQQPHAVVVGAGIGGLAAAVALHLRGWHVTVLERARALEHVGAGIAIAPNALRALEVLGVGDEVRAMAAFQGEGGLRRPDGRWVSRTSGEAAAERFGGPVVIAHRAELVALLAGRLPDGAVRTGNPVVSADPDGQVATEHESFDADLVVAADGIRSVVRSALFPDHPGPAYSGFTNWRLVVPAPAAYVPHESWGRGLLWGTVPLTGDRVYCYATAVTPPGGRSADGDERTELRRLFGDWHHPVPEVIAAAAPGTVLRNDVHHLAVPLPAFHRGRIALLGDAAHAMTPNLGQGGCQAIEDAVVLAHLAGPGDDTAAALAAYSAQRLPRTTDVMRRSRSVGRLTTWSSRPAVALRDTLFATVNRFGPRLALHSLDGIADWRPPQAPYAASGDDRAPQAGEAHGTPEDRGDRTR
ncbi:FAD-dependent monooxygenase [Streptomyces sp. NPDC002574]|uniref:FAD-dependent monooxygenase n=1 Tax=Streptomyces sp. NPDC002574 TaxID=3364652 RepID=UPI003674A114